MTDWHFHRLRPGPSVSEPTQGEFFHQDTIGDALQPLVREGIQNALDARPQNSLSPVSVRIALKSGAYSCKNQAATQLFSSEMWQHIKSDGNGLNPDSIPSRQSNCDYLVFEDFGTTGLSGDIRQYVRKEGKGSNFYNFFRATGSTDKGGGTLGKWGIGKHTFWMASQINTIFGFSVRNVQNANAPTHVLIGKTILKSHAINSSNDWDFQDGYYGTRENNSDLVLPLTDEHEIAKFKDIFNLNRNDESGLSLVVPWPTEAILKIKMQDFVDSIIKDYFYPIVTNQLSVTVEINDNKKAIDAASINSVANSSIKRLIELAQAVKIDKNGRYTITPQSLPKPEWHKNIIEQEVLDKLCEAYNNEEKIHIRARLGISHKKTTRHKDSYFDICFVQDNNSTGAGRPCFIRQGIIIPDVRGGRIGKNITALVIIEDSHLADFLGASENPSHTQWQQQLLTDKYNNVGKILEYVCFSVQKIVEIITQADENRDHSILSNIFPMPRSGDDEPPIDPPPPTIQPFIIKPIDKGFSFNHNPKNPTPIGTCFFIEIAYSMRNGNAFSNYNLNDFVINKLQTEVSGINITNIDSNTMQMETTQDEFFMKIHGFDENRDIEINAIIEQQDVS